jgi:hypothetical protein
MRALPQKVRKARGNARKVRTEGKETCVIRKRRNCVIRLGWSQTVVVGSENEDGTMRGQAVARGRNAGSQR